MTVIIGTDEAGYGPSLGPLVISATFWRIPEHSRGDALYERLPSIRSASLPSRARGGSLVIADSKKLYVPGGGLGELERMVLAALGVAPAGRPGTWREMFLRCDPSCAEPLGTIPWYVDYDRSLPVDACPDAVAEAVSTLADVLHEGEVQLVAIESRVVFPAAFNERVAACGSKGTALSLWTLELVEQMMARAGDESVLIQCDKHGARNRYGALLQQIFPEYLVQVCEESKPRSVYRWGPKTARVEAVFSAKGERFLPSALASMVSKYLRELAMMAFNGYWRALDGQLKATAGYPADARRFREAIRETQRRLEIPDSILWRNR